MQFLYGREKQARASFHASTKFRASRPPELVYTDLCGPITPSKLRGGRYFLLIVDVGCNCVEQLEHLKAFQKYKTLGESESKEERSSA